MGQTSGDRLVRSVNLGIISKQMIVVVISMERYILRERRSEKERKPTKETLKNSSEETQQDVQVLANLWKGRSKTPTRV